MSAWRRFPRPSRVGRARGSPTSETICGAGRGQGRRVLAPDSSNVSTMTAQNIPSSANAARLALLVHAEVIGDASGAQLGQHTNLREQLGFLLANLRHLADESGIGWEAVLIEADADHAADLSDTARERLSAVRDE